MVTLAATDMRVVNQSNTVGDEHEHMQWEHKLWWQIPCKRQSAKNGQKKPKVTLIQETKYLLLSR